MVFTPSQLGDIRNCAQQVLTQYFQNEKNVDMFVAEVAHMVPLKLPQINVHSLIAHTDAFKNNVLSRVYDILATRIVNNILSATDDCKRTTLVFLDFSKAFDAVSHSLVTASLHFIDFDNDNNYLSDRLHYVKLEENKSGDSTASGGVSQGSILSLQNSIDLANKHSLVINPSKSHVLLFGRRKSPRIAIEHVNIQIKDTQLSVVDVSRNLRLNLRTY
ncbi:hypothetical protein ILUMI_19748 [Ignelater luminosus]|uniref:Reverse transcriptase domain-containing protein n=1 Tax=Ignelater luminosus TaxID=2038154 RepID=A0A8K0FZK9_IGNLU|nr:hypothetical protein ILUMI_19748 [Ignelater luminosus]